ncbi:hypothetical protein [Pantoea dispersa]|uniref:hypothetical protein n=1 Tax=Pantoea dispersa TaxID=59814 RepID=UPI0021F6EE89|nr:hypothetical protein [Pantoea dispersa]MCW0319933.1 hypothetical protein [Pantoea dispersa]MCW0324669.1 hypothetical protein [Pantoea dispersa]MCW0431603.1 hypothetical protein [Pantoea dispersa]
MSVIIDNQNDGQNLRGAVPINRDIDKSLKVYQEIYQHITGRTEKITQKCSDNLIIDLSEVKLTHSKINQLCNVHNIVVRNESVTVFHTKERKEQFTEFRQFELYSSATTSPTINVILKYNFAILPVGGQIPNQYVVTVKLTSKLAMQQQMEEEAPPFIRGRFISFMISDAAEISIEYADYIVARSFIDAFNEWANGCKRSVTGSELPQRFQLISHFIPTVMRYSFAFLILTLGYLYIGSYLKDAASFEDKAHFFMLFFAAFFMIPEVARMIGSNIERAIDNYVPPSYLLLNKGDERLLDDYKRRNKKNVRNAILNAIIAIILGIASSRIDKLL